MKTFLDKYRKISLPFGFDVKLMDTTGCQYVDIQLVPNNDSYETEALFNELLGLKLSPRFDTDSEHKEYIEVREEVEGVACWVCLYVPDFR